MSFALSILLLIALFLEGTLTSLPLVFLVLLCWTVVRRDESVFPAALVSGLVLDLFAVRFIGQTSVFLVSAMALLLLYQRKYEITSYPFVGVAGGVGALLFLLFFGEGNVVVQSAISVLVAMVLFGVVKKYTL